MMEMKIIRVFILTLSFVGILLVSCTNKNGATNGIRIELEDLNYCEDSLFLTNKFTNGKGLSGKVITDSLVIYIVSVDDSCYYINSENQLEMNEKNFIKIDRYIRNESRNSRYQDYLCVYDDVAYEFDFSARSLITLDSNFKQINCVELEKDFKIGYSSLFFSVEQ